MGIIDKKDLEQMLNSIITALSGVLKVDILSSEKTITDEIITSTDSSPYTILTPTSGKTISTRGVTINTDSSGGEIAVKLANSGELIYKIYVGKFRGQVGIGLNKKDLKEEIRIMREEIKRRDK